MVSPSSFSSPSSSSHQTHISSNPSASIYVPPFLCLLTMRGLPFIPAVDSDGEPVSLLTSVFYHMTPNKRFALAWTMNSEQLLRACLQSAQFLDFFLMFESPILRECIEYQYGNKTPDMKWKSCPLLGQTGWKTDDTNVKLVIEMYLDRFHLGPSNDPGPISLLDPTALVDLSSGPEPTWRLIFWFFPNLPKLIAFEKKFLTTTNPRLWAFVPRFRPLYIPHRCPRQFSETKLTTYQVIRNVDLVHGPEIRGLYDFCNFRRIVVLRDYEGPGTQADLWTDTTRLMLIHLEMSTWIRRNYTLNTIKDMFQVYTMIDDFMVELWRRALSFARADGDYLATPAGIEPEPLVDHNRTWGTPIEMSICRRTIDRLMTTIGDDTVHINRNPR